MRHHHECSSRQYWTQINEVSNNGHEDTISPEGYLPSLPKFTRSKLHVILTDRAYIGEIRYHGQWHITKAIIPESG